MIERRVGEANGLTPNAKFVVGNREKIAAISKKCSQRISRSRHPFSIGVRMKSIDDRKNVRIRRRDLLAGGVAIGALAATGRLRASEAPADAILGPIVGHTDATQSILWMRIPTAGKYQLRAEPASGGKAIVVEAKAAESNDSCLHWHVTGLQPDTLYRYRVLQGERPIADGAEQRFRTAPKPDEPSKIKLAISSCAREDRGSREVWERMAAEEVDAVVLIGDTPYIDSTRLAEQTRRYREFATVEEYQRLLRNRPCWWTWDDHDFAGNDSDGQAAGKENSRLAYSRYRPQLSYGDSEGGIYTSFRYGPVEVFLLDTRWFARTEPSFAGPAKSTLLGAAQWQWLQQGLKRSTAPVKLLACGMIWDDKENRESDDWGTYSYERSAIEKFIASEKISGVILVGGDIHASRVLRYGTKSSIGYDLLQFIASPIHGKVIPSLNVYHPELIRSAVEPHVFLSMEIDATRSPVTLQAELINRRGERVFTYAQDVSELAADQSPDDAK
jgi:alkaline phosphatase D